MKSGSKRRRSRATIEAQKLEALTRQQVIEDKLKNLERLIEENAELKQQQEAGTKAQVAIQQMMSAGYIQVAEDGSYCPGEDYGQTEGR